MPPAAYVKTTITTIQFAKSPIIFIIINPQHRIRDRDMAAEDTSKVSEAYPMNGGDGPNSYAKNSTYQVSFIVEDISFIV